MDRNWEDSQASGDIVDLRHYWIVMKRHGWTILACVLLAGVSSFLLALTETSVYKSTATLMIEPKAPKIYSIEEMLATDNSSREYYNSQYQIIKSRQVAEKVIRKLDLLDSREFFPKAPDGFITQVRHAISTTFSGWVKSVVSLLDTGSDREAEAIETGRVQAETEEQRRMKKLTSAFLGRVDVEPVSDSRLVQVSFHARDPVLARQAADSVVTNYIEFNLENRIEAAQDAAQWLQKRLDEAQVSVEKAERQLQQFKEKHGIVTTFSEESEKLTAQTLSELNQQLTQAKARRVGAEARYKQARTLLDNTSDMSSVTELASNDTVSRIHQEEVLLQCRMVELAHTYGANHPKMVGIQSQLDELNKAKEAEMKRIVSSLESEYRVALAGERSLEMSLNQIKEGAQSINREAVEYSVLKRKAQSARNMYKTLLQRYEKASLGKDIESGNIRLVEGAEIPDSPVRPRPKRNLIFGLSLGLMAGLGLAFLLEHLDNAIKTPDDVKHLGIPFLTGIHDFSGIYAPEGEPKELVTVYSPMSFYSEAYRSLRTSVMFSQKVREAKTLLVTSPGPAEGKSITCVNLAVTLAQHGSKTLLLDCDLRNPNLHKMFNAESEPGLSGFLAHKAELSKVIRETHIPQLDLATAGPVPSNPWVLLSSTRMVKLIDSLSDHYDFIIMDSPPVTAVTDPLLLARLSGGIVVVLREGQTGRHEVKNTLEILTPVHQKILGAVLNAVKRTRDSRYYYQYYYQYHEGGNRKKTTRSV
ncbi:capsular exopolysaccharide synthesis family protein [Desulfosalsimonas propionicica]|uniref:Capsular exopolysaccharide synthesis family protein n=1 Tax=Desulfosalsimonas propionicica TaxID=332175 RepID=A0A7W0C962_9BACT|nr:polysaccharide biosynthesis tyrosine autokinase [Desulfosalsimonas propionicica]MBA2881452.1 capsular exopolysaccharide synthesis family protein [Desulfosalsimonas propionicica]